MDGDLISGPAAAADPTASLVGARVLAIGTDLVDIDRIRAVIERQPGFVARVFTEAETAYCRKRQDPAERFAARFAAKEAVLKALGTGLGGADFTDIEVVRLDSGQPILNVTGRAAERAAELGIARWLVTLTHSQHLAQAFVAALADDSDGPDRGLGRQPGPESGR